MTGVHSAGFLFSVNLGYTYFTLIGDSRVHLYYLLCCRTCGFLSWYSVLAPTCDGWDKLR